MRNIRLEMVTKRKGKDLVLDNVSLNIPSGGFFALLGPSGCGKTTLLRLIAGLEKVDGGKIFIGDKEITNVPVHKRKVNIIFQNYALFPHMTVAENIGYSLTIKSISSAEIECRVCDLLKTFHLENMKNKKPCELSGGQQQRVAIARAIINEPEVLLLDEPLAALDFKLREKLLIELIDLQARLLTTFVYVTHDQFEALTVADQMAIMGTNGNIEQIGTPKEIYEFPVSTFVAEFVGNTNIFEGELMLQDDKYKFCVDNLGNFNLSSTKKILGEISDGNKYVMSVRPEKVFISKTPVKNFSDFLRGTVVSILYTGRSTLYEVVLENGKKIQVFEQNDEHFQQDEIDYDDEVNIYWQKENALLLER